MINRRILEALRNRLDMTTPSAAATRNAIILFAHGSSILAANQAVERVAAELGRRSEGFAIAAFLEQASPDLAEAIERAVGAGAFRVMIVPYFLSMGMHISKDLPELVRQQQVRFPGLEVHIAAPMEGHPLLLDVLLDRMKSADQGTA